MLNVTLICFEVNQYTVLFTLMQMKWTLERTIAINQEKQRFYVHSVTFLTFSLFFFLEEACLCSQCVTILYINCKKSDFILCLQCTTQFSPLDGGNVF